MDSFKAFIAAITNVIKTFGISDFIDIVIVSYLIYKAINLVRETRAGQLVKGILLLAFAYFCAHLINLKTISFVLEYVFQIGLIAVIIMFQPELRRALEKVGRTKITDLSVFSGETMSQKSDAWKNAIDNIVKASKRLSDTKTGALMVIEQQTKLGEQIETGVLINANVEENLLCNIFFHNSPLHDGAIVIRDGRILAAACFLPKPQKENYIETQLGSRH
ncbi:MAG: diadenylate cyclase, partial [Oscillospiraceae bacterium]